jgi:hypothetical protein
MRTIWFRIISAIVLIVVVMMFSGLASTIDAAQTVTSEATSDNHCNQEPHHECPIPCETQICPLCLCVIADVVHPIEIQPSFQIIELGYADVTEAIPDPYIVEIFHPPTVIISV